ncbi:hypothetical protein DEO72_LG10g2214 [Vigna unguiculata]|uniref:Uncharacterized protein n=1 Tax=Vigna unguiculata TaxID=3917 RepID=A0A4D6NDN4_VIGUN|nr:hypothetical protein DEO72_LG10g2214 [Vigna unguiculata]
MEVYTKKRKEEGVVEKTLTKGFFPLTWQPLLFDTTTTPTSGTAPAPPDSPVTTPTTVASPAGDDVVIRSASREVPLRQHTASLPAASIDAGDVALVLGGSTISLSKANPERSLPRRHHSKTSAAAAAASTTDVDGENPETLDLHSPSLRLDSQARLALLSRHPGSLRFPFKAPNRRRPRRRRWFLLLCLSLCYDWT